MTMKKEIFRPLFGKAIETSIGSFLHTSGTRGCSCAQVLETESAMTKARIREQWNRASKICLTWQAARNLSMVRVTWFQVLWHGELLTTPIFQLAERMSVYR